MRVGMKKKKSEKFSLSQQWTQVICGTMCGTQERANWIECGNHTYF